MAELGEVTRALLAIARDLRDDRALAERICRACVVGLDIDGAAISLHTASTLRETLFATDATADLLEDLQFSLGEGACIEAARTGRPVLVPDMTDSHATRAGGRSTPRPWSEQAGVGAVFALPLQWGTINLGVLDLYRTTPGLAEPQPKCRTPERRGNGRADAARAAHRPRRRTQAWDPSWSSRAEIHQATGMVLVQLGVSAPTPSPGCAPTLSSSSGSSATSPATWWPGGCGSPRTHDRYGDRRRGGLE